ncbi:MAG: bifunctional hydroxymethylpyrimidine kinase/phosphomethylpyrimidine kinase [Beijerinckiaceae bacterium]|nr:MAG: bifunctional hydroxymethylpyrimidine kinase/phosphomethylpyrimidine kinase [Beijerinckiaceae bacterium]
MTAVETIPNVLAIAGSDPCGGAGIQADLKTFAALGCYGLSAITALTAQNTLGVENVCLVPADFVAAQIDALFADCTISAVKIGMTGSPDIIEVIREKLARNRPQKVVLDPVLAASSGAALTVGDVAATLVNRLASHVSLITPNLMEAAVLAKVSVPKTLDDMRDVAKRLHGLGFAAILVKGGHRDGATCDDLLYDGREFQIFSTPRVATRNTHGTGCTLSSAITAFLAKGYELPDAVEAAKSYLQNALEHADRLDVGKGHGPLHHFYRFW